LFGKITEECTMAQKITEQSVKDIIDRIKHPAIDRTLVDLGIIKSMLVKANKVLITMAFPFPDIPIGDHLVNSVREPVQRLGAEIEVKLTVMDQAERERFLAMEQESWKGIIPS